MSIPESLDSKRLKIRRFKKSDFDSFFRFLSDPKATQHLTFSEGELGRENVEAFFAEIIDSYDTSNPIFGYAVVEKSSGKYVGAMGLTALTKEKGSETIFVFLPEFWRKGYATEAGKALFTCAFEVFSVPKIVSFLADENQAGIRLAEKLGMEFDQMVKHREYPRPVKRYVLTREKFLS